MSRIFKNELKAIIREALEKHMLFLESVPSVYVKNNDTITLYHYSKRNEPTILLDPVRASTERNPFSSREWSVSDVPRLFFYIDPREKENFFTENYTLYQVNVQSSDIIQQSDLSKEEQQQLAMSMHNSNIDAHMLLQYIAGLKKQGGGWIKNTESGKYEKDTTPVTWQRTGLAKSKGFYYKNPSFQTVVWFEPITLQRVSDKERQSLEMFGPLAVRSQNLDESKFPRVMRMLHGLVDNVNSIGFITAENPESTPTAAAANNVYNANLFRDLKALGYGPVRIVGKFGNKEKTFLVPNVEKNDLVSLSMKYKQQAVIWGTKSSNDVFTFEFIEHGKTINKRQVALSGSDVEQLDDFYSQVDGRKFVIPFFDEKWEIETNDHSSEANMLRETYNRSIVSLLKQIEYRTCQLQEANKTKKYYWIHRNMLELAKQKLSIVLRNS